MPEAVNDSFGIKKIYPTNTHPIRAKPWLMGKGNWRRRIYDGWGDWDDWNILPDGEGSDVITLSTPSDKGRFPVMAVSPLEHEPAPYELDQRKLRKRGYMKTKNDWKNVEVTLYWYLNSKAYNVPELMAFSARGGPHHSNRSRCSGTCYQVAIRSDGTISITKELAHGYYTESQYVETDFKLYKRWVGMKGIFYTKANGNPKIEIWLDKNANKKNANQDWGISPMLEYADTGGWVIKKKDENGNLVNSKGRCYGKSDEKITWGGPGVIFKLNNLGHVFMKWASIREILPREGWPLKYLLNTRDVPSPFSMRTLADEYGLTAPISLRRLTQLEAEKYPFP